VVCQLLQIWALLAHLAAVLETATQTVVVIYRRFKTVAIMKNRKKIN
jgi:hypothetical protein